MTLVCTELKRIQIDGTVILIFVDKNGPGGGDGRSWSRAFKGVNQALDRALAIRRAQKGPVQWINILVAGGDYTFDHEDQSRDPKGTKGLSKRAPIIDISGTEKLLYQKISILGGYRSGDQCLENDKNKSMDGLGDDGRISTLDGMQKSNNVINVTDGAQHINIKGFTVKGGKAEEVGKQDGGAIAIEEASQIDLEDLVLRDSEAQGNGGCLAITSTAHHIRLMGVTMDGCKADNEGGAAVVRDHANNISYQGVRISQGKAGTSGGGLLISDNANNVTLDDVQIRGCTAGIDGGGLALMDDVHTVIASGLTIESNEAQTGGGGLLIDRQVGTVGGPDNINLKKVVIHNNKLTSSNTKGGGVLIKGQAQQVRFEDITIYGNELPASDYSFGGGVAIVGKAKDIGFYSGTIGGNSAGRKGGGVYLGEMPESLPNAVNWLPEPLLSFSDINIDGNRIIKASTASFVSHGAGMAIEGRGQKNTTEFYRAHHIEIKGGSISNNHGDVEGIGIALLGKVYNVVIDGVDIAANYTDDKMTRSGNGLLIAPDNPRGGILLDNGDIRAVTLKNGTRIRDHKYGLEGAGLFAHKSINGLSLDGVVIANNSSKGDGGGMHAKNIQHLELKGGTRFENNHSDLSGGGLYLEDVTLAAFDDVKFLRNTTQHAGGGFSLLSSRPSAPGPFGGIAELMLSNISCDYNWAGNTGGCAHFNSELRISLEFAIMKNNGLPQPDKSIAQATKYGGALSFNMAETHISNKTMLGQPDGWLGPTINIKNSLFQENASSLAGGALHTDGAFALKIEDSTFMDNRTEGVGGSLNVKRLWHQLYLSRSTFENNVAHTNAGGIYVEGAQSSKFTSHYLPRVKLGTETIIKGSKVNAPGTSGSAGVYLTKVNRLAIEEAEFIRNVVYNASSSSKWAAALKWQDRLAPELGFIPDTSRKDTYPLVIVGAAFPVHYNRVDGLWGTTNKEPIGTISVPRQLHEFHLIYWFKGLDTAFTAEGNVPAPVSQQPEDVIIAHD